MAACRPQADSETGILSFPIDAAQMHSNADGERLIRSNMAVRVSESVQVSSRVLLQSQTSWRFADEGDRDAKPMC